MVACSEDMLQSDGSGRNEWKRGDRNAIELNKEDRIDSDE